MARRRAKVAQPEGEASSPPEPGAAPCENAETVAPCANTGIVDSPAEVGATSEPGCADGATPEPLDRKAADGEAGGDDAATVELCADLGFAAARDLHARLRGLRECGRVVLDASKVERMSTAAVLVVVSFLNARADMSPPAAVTGASEAFVDAFSELGLFASLMRMEFLA